MALAAGIHVGTKEVRAILADERGSVIGRNRTAVRQNQAERELPSGYVEQDANLLWKTVENCLKELASSTNANPEDIAAAGVSTASGTLIPIDASGQALRPAIMAEDSRSGKETKLANQKGETLIRKHGYQFDESSSLAKVIWLRKQEPGLFGKTLKFIHVSDFIAGKLCGEFYATDTSNALDSGYDLIDLKWAPFLRELGLFPETLPEVVKPGEPIGSVLPSVAGQVGFSKRTRIMAGTTDEIVFLACSGAVSAGDWNSHLGERLSVRGITPKLIKDKLFRIHSHLHPENLWIPTGTSCVGKLSVREKFREGNFPAKEKPKSPSNLIVYPLNHQGEKLPFVNPDAQGFIIGKPADEYDLYSGYLEGVGYVEKWIFELLGELGFEVGGQIFVTGSDNELWLQIRANILEKVLIKPESDSPEMGTAILSASKTVFRSLSEAAKSMVHAGKQIEPESQEIHRVKYRKFRQACRAIGYE